MKKSIRGNIKTKTQTDKELIVADINKYLLWKLDTQDVEDEEGNASFSFEAWVENDKDELSLWSDMKKHVEKHKLNSKIDRHDCSHDEKYGKSCEILEQYEVE